MASLLYLVLASWMIGFHVVTIESQTPAVAMLSSNKEDVNSYGQILTGSRGYCFNVTIPYLNTVDKICHGYAYNISRNVSLNPYLNEQKGIFVSTAYKTQRYLMNIAKQSSEGYVLIDSDNTYRPGFLIVTTEPHDKSTGINNATINVAYGSQYPYVINVTVHLKLSGGYLNFNDRRYLNGDMLNISLQPNSTFQVSHKYDLSGTRVYSGVMYGSVYVTSGNICNRIGHGPCSHLIEMMPPYLCTTYIVPLLMHIDHVILRIVASESNTFVMIEVNGKAETHDLQDGEYLDRRLKGTDVVTVIGLKRLLVTQIAERSLFNRKIGPFMMNVLGTCQYQTEYLFAVPDEGFESFVTIVVELSGSDKLRLDSQVIVPPSDTKVISLSGKYYTAFTLPVSRGNHSIHSVTIIGIPFSLSIYGFRDRDGYGYPGAVIYTDSR